MIREDFDIDHHTQLAVPYWIASGHMDWGQLMGLAKDAGPADASQ